MVHMRYDLFIINEYSIIVTLRFAIAILLFLLHLLSNCCPLFYPEKIFDSTLVRSTRDLNIVQFKKYLSVNVCHRMGKLLVKLIRVITLEVFEHDLWAL